MKYAKKHIFGKILLFTFLFCLAISSAGFVYFLTETNSVSLDESKFLSSKNKMAFMVVDSSGNELDKNNEIFGGDFVKLSELPDYVGEAFVATEDKRFYQHHGIDYKRMAGALVKNIKSKKAKEGASTITQQLIKNTHLTNEKTLKRKLTEIRLARKAERVMSKEQILEEYLNAIYFGNGVYGISNASRTYYNKPASELSIGEAAMLAGVINAPSYYDIFSNQARCEERKKLVLSLMKNQGYISEEEYQKNANMTENIVKNSKKASFGLKKAIISEACEALKVSENQLKNMDILVKCNLDFSLQKSLDEMLESGNFNPLGENNNSSSSAVLVVENKTKKIIAFSSNGASDYTSTKRQPGSLIKPLIVYAPALEGGLISPESIINDEPISINGYSPTNANKSYHGKVSAREALSKSLNIPAVKTLSNVGVSRAKNFALGLGIEFESADQNLALALGGMTKGVTLKQLADAYSAFASNGEFAKTSIISEITNKNHRVLYSSKVEPKMVMKSSTAYLVTDMLKDTVNNGTARRLKGFNFDIAAKTGTVGANQSSSNLAAYTAAYTSEHTIICFVGSNAKSGLLPASVNGASYPASMAKIVLEKLYTESSPKPFIIPDTVVTRDIDTRSLESGEVRLAAPSAEEKYKRPALFARDNLPEMSTEVDKHNAVISVSMEEGQKPTLSFTAKKGYTYDLVRKSNGKEEIVFSYSGVDKKVDFVDTLAQSGAIYEYYVLSTSELSKNVKGTSNTVKLMSY